MELFMELSRKRNIIEEDIHEQVWKRMKEDVALRLSIGEFTMLNGVRQIELIKRGGNGKIYTTTDPKKILKISKLSDNCDVSDRNNTATMEILTMCEMESSPVVYDYGIVKHEATFYMIILMERLDGDLVDRLVSINQTHELESIGDL